MDTRISHHRAGGLVTEKQRSKKVPAFEGGLDGFLACQVFGLGSQDAAD